MGFNLILYVHERYSPYINACIWFRRSVKSGMCVLSSRITHATLMVQIFPEFSFESFCIKPLWSNGVCTMSRARPKCGMLVKRKLTFLLRGVWGNTTNILCRCNGYIYSNHLNIAINPIHNIISNIFCSIIINSFFIILQSVYNNNTNRRLI